MLILEKYEKITTKSPKFFEKMETTQNRERDRMGI